MKNRFSSLLFAGILILSSILSGCSSKTDTAEAKEKVVVNFWSFWGSETRRPVIEKIVNDFNNSQDRIIVKHTFIPWGDIWTKKVPALREQ